MLYIEPCKPPVYFYHYSNPESQGALMRQTEKWPLPEQAFGCFQINKNEDIFIYERDQSHFVNKKIPVPDGLQIIAEYTDRMFQWDSKKYDKASKELPQGGFKNASDDQLISFCKVYWPNYDIVAVRVIYFYNVATGFDCPVVEFLYKDKSKSME